MISKFEKFTIFELPNVIQVYAVSTVNYTKNKAGKRVRVPRPSQAMLDNVGRDLPIYLLHKNLFMPNVKGQGGENSRRPQLSKKWIISDDGKLLLASELKKAGRDEERYLKELRDTAIDFIDQTGLFSKFLTYWLTK